jgi:iron-sulfur cluster repair protein YtfE (RIC family)
MENIKSFLSTDHKDCDNAFADTENAIVANNWDQAGREFEKMSTIFLKHFNMEETVLFPEFEECSGMSCGPTQVMRMEHEQMRQAILKLEIEILNKDKDRALGICETFNILTQQHNSKEEMILYTMADNILTDKATEIISKMKSVA